MLGWHRRAAVDILTKIRRIGMIMTKRRLIALIIASLCVNLACGENDKSTEPEPFPRTLILDYGAVWSGTHDLIAYIHKYIPFSDDPDSNGIYIISPDGTGKRKIYEGHFIFGIDWSDDGNWIIADSNNRLVKISFPDGAADTLTGSGKYYWPVWSPDGQNILYSIHAGDNAGVYIADSSGGNSRQILAYCKAAAWPYPDSLIYLNLYSQYVIGSLYISDTSGAYRKEIFMDDRFIPTTLVPKMNAATRRIVFHAQIPGEPLSCWLLEPDFVEIRLMSRFAERPNFSPDGEKIVYTNTHEDNGRLWIIGWDGIGLRQLTY
jgi:hypothetical protein